MKVVVYFNWQIGLMVCLGKTYENRMYISFEKGLHEALKLITII